MSSTVALNKNAFPTRQHMPANSVQLSPVFLRKSSSANQAFVRFAVTSSAAQSAIALNSTSVLEPFNRCGSRSREPLFRPTLCRGPAPVLWAER